MSTLVPLTMLPITHLRKKIAHCQSRIAVEGPDALEFVGSSHGFFGLPSAKSCRLVLLEAEEEIARRGPGAEEAEAQRAIDAQIRRTQGPPLPPAGNKSSGPGGLRDVPTWVWIAGVLGAGFLLTRR